MPDQERLELQPTAADRCQKAGQLFENDRYASGQISVVAFADCLCLWLCAGASLAQELGQRAQRSRSQQGGKAGLVAFSKAFAVRFH